MGMFAFLVAQELERDSREQERRKVELVEQDLALAKKVRAPLHPSLLTLIRPPPTMRLRYCRHLFRCIGDASSQHNLSLCGGQLQLCLHPLLAHNHRHRLDTPLSFDPRLRAQPMSSLSFPRTTMRSASALCSVSLA